MSRLTEKLKSGNYICGIIKGGFVDKLGKLEDLLESYNVKDLEELDKLLEMATTYEELSKQLGCPLDVVGKAIFQNCFYDVEYDRYRETDIGFIPEEQILVISIDEWENGNTLLLSDYKKTWWLKSDRSE